jgi:hypothetical protein
MTPALVLVMALAQPWSLSVTAPAACTTREALQASIDAPATAFVEPARGQETGAPLDVVLEATATGWKATVQWGGSRESLTTDAADCHALDARLATVLALVIDPTKATRASPASTAPPPRATVQVHVVADDPRVRLTAVDQFMPSLTAVRVLCGVPCDKPLPADATFFATGVGLVPSDAFTLGLEVTRATVSVQVGHTGARSAWSIIASVGGASLGAGLVTLLVGALLHRAPWPTVGGAVAGSGAALLIGGLVGVSLTSTRVTVTAE